MSTDTPTPTLAGDEVPADARHAARNELVVQHLPLVRSIAARLYRLRWNASVGFDEYCQMGAMGLLEAAERFDPNRGAAFATFATWRISGSILNGLINSTEQHQQIASRRRLVQSRVDLLADVAPADGTAPPGDAFDAALARLAGAAIGLAVGFMLEGTGMFDDGAGTEGLDGYASLALRQTRQRLRAAVAAMPDQERQVIDGHYLQQQSFSDIAAAMGLTRGRISQVHRSGIDRLRETLRRDGAHFEA